MDVPPSPAAVQKDVIASSLKAPTPSSPVIPKPNQQLPRAVVLRGRTRFELLFEKGRRVGNRSLTLLLLSSSDSKPGRAAFITPKKIGTAVVRNQLRRRLREIYRRHLPHLAPRLHADVVILAKSEALKLDFSALTQSFLELYAKLVEKADSP